MLYRNIKHEAVYSLERQKRPAAIRQPGATQRNTTQRNTIRIPRVFFVPGDGSRPGAAPCVSDLARQSRHHSDRLAGIFTPFRRRDKPGSRCPVIQFECIIAQDMTYCNGENLRHSPRLDISRCISYIVPMYDVLEQRYQRQMAELERQQVQQKLAAQVAEAPCSPL